MTASTEIQPAMMRQASKDSGRHEESNQTECQRIARANRAAPRSVLGHQAIHQDHRHEYGLQVRHGERRRRVEDNRQSSAAPAAMGMTFRSDAHRAT